MRLLLRSSQARVTREVLRHALEIGLGAVAWSRIQSDSAALEGIDRELTRALALSDLEAQAAYLQQRDATSRIRDLFDERGIDHVLIKGGHVRERVYEDPAVRRASDLDILVAREDRQRAASSLIDSGFSVHADPSTVSHEVLLVKDKVMVDLHWDLLRPGRSRCEVAGWFLDSRRDCGSHWSPPDEATLWLLLVHPVIAKYAPAHNAGLFRVLDIAHWMQRVEIDWERVVGMLERSGLKTCAWQMLRWTESITSIRAPGAIMRQLQPKALRRSYLKLWTSARLNDRLADYPRVIRLGYTLPVMDSAKDAVRFLVALSESKRLAPSEAALFDSLSTQHDQK